MAPSEDETPEDAWFLGQTKIEGDKGHCGVVLGLEPSGNFICDVSCQIVRCICIYIYSCWWIN